MNASDHSTLYRKLIEHMNEAVWMGDSNERTVYANPKFCSLMGYTLEEMLGRESYDFWDKESAARVRNVNMTKRKKDISSSYEGNLLTKSGELIPVLLSGTPLPEGGSIGIMTDLTELKQREEKERVLHRAIMYATDAIIIVDRSGTIESWNKGAKLIFGYSEKDILGKPLTKIFKEEDVDTLLGESKVRFNLELEGTHKNKQAVTIATTISPVEQAGKKGPAALCLLIARDITGQRKFEEELTLKYQKMREAYNQFGIMRRQMDYVFELVDICNQQSDLQDVTNFIVNSTIMLTRVDACVLRKYNELDQTLELAASFGVTADWQSKGAIAYPGSLAERAYLQGTPQKIIDLTKESKYTSAQLARKHHLSSLLVIALSHQGKLLGSLTLYVRPEKKLELFENDFIEQYAKLISTVVAHPWSSAS